MGILTNLFKPNTELVDWQVTLTGSYSDKRRLSKAQLIKMTEQVIADNMRIFDDSVNIINSTTKPDVMFSRLELAEKCLLKLRAIEPYLKYQNKFTFNEMPSDLYERFQDEKQSYIHTFLLRCETAVVDKAYSMKTEKGRKNQFDKFYQSVQEYMRLMNDGNRRYIEYIMDMYK